MLVRLLLLALLALAAPAQSTDVFQKVDEMVSTLSEITGWKIEKRVPSEMLSNQKFRHLVESGMKDASGSKEVRAEELTLKMFGFVPQNFDLVKASVEVVSEQAAAFYDYHKKRLFILESTPPGFDQEIALVHELAHALADQHHHLGKYLKQGSPDDDAATAREAVMEGQATWLTAQYVLRHGGKEETQPAGADGSEFPAFSNAPLYVRESLVFPYNEGRKFQDALYRRLGRKSFDEVYENPPLSTQQILHPDAYLAGEKPLDPELPKPEAVFGKDARRFQALAEGSLGEFDHAVLLRQYVSGREGTEAATHWRGGTYRLYENKREKYPVLVFVSAWDSPESARKFFTLYQRVMKGKWKKMEIAENSQDEISGSGDSGRFRLRLTGSVVESIEGLR
jgi:hypothetical protein